MEMHKLPTFTQWLYESAELDPLKLVELGLWTGPVIEWQIDMRWDKSLSIGSQRLGTVNFIPNWPTREYGEDYRYYLRATDFNLPLQANRHTSKIQPALYRLLKEFYLGKPAEPALIAWCSANLYTLINNRLTLSSRWLTDDRYTPLNVFESGPVLARCLNNGQWQLVLPAE